MGWPLAFAVGFAFLAMLPGVAPASVLKDYALDQLGAGDRGAALFLGAGMLGSVLFAPVVGWWSDRLGRRLPFVVFGALANAVCWFLLSGVETLGMALALRLVEGASSVAILGPLYARVADLERHAHGAAGSTTAFGWTGMLLMGGAAAGLAIGGVLGNVHPLWPFYLASVVMLANALLAPLLLREQRTIADNSVQNANADDATGTGAAPNSATTASPAPQSFREEMGRKSREAWQALRFASPLVVAALLLSFADRAGSGYLSSSFNLFLRTDLDLNPASVGGMLGMVMLLMAALSAPAAGLARRFGALQVAVAGSLIYGAALILTGWFYTPGPLWLVAILAGIGAGLMSSPTMMLVARRAPAALSGAVLSLYVGAGSLGNLLGPIASTELIAAVAAPGVLASALAFGALQILLALLLWALGRAEAYSTPSASASVSAPERSSSGVSAS